MLLAFHKALSITQPLAEAGGIITSGILLTQAKTRYGYIEAGKTRNIAHYPVSRFIVKPNTETAQKHLDADNYFWNSGMFMASTLLNEILPFILDIVDACKLSLNSSVDDMDFTRWNPSAFKLCPPEPIDHAMIIANPNHVQNIKTYSAIKK
jgi:mannose-1-phosphate guanylyltransferase